MVALQITFQDYKVSDAVSEAVRKRVDKLEKVFDRIVACHVSISIPHRHHKKGKIHHVHLRLSLPNHELVMSREASKDSSHEDVYVAIRDAFDALERRLKDYVDRLRGGDRYNYYRETPALFAFD